MQSDIWKNVIDTISVVNPESVDTESIKSMLNWDRTYSIEVLDSLYMRKIITLEEYMEYVHRYIHFKEDNIKWANERLVEAQEKKSDFNPYVYYGLGMMSRGIVIDNLLHSDP